jgi:hypothetical protein
MMDTSSSFLLLADARLGHDAGWAVPGSAAGAAPGTAS